MTGIPSTTVTEARGRAATPSTNVDKIAIFVGVTSLGSGLSSFFLNSASLIASVGLGDVVDAACQTLEQEGVPVAIYSTPEDSPGSYGAVDSSGVTGTTIITMDSDVEPVGTYEARLLFTEGGTIGTAGIKFRYSLDNGRHYSRIISLGTAVDYTIPDRGVKFLFDPPTAQITALVTLANELRTDYEAHRVLTAGSVHGAADNTNAVAASAASDLPTAITLLNEIKADYNAHRILTAGSVHGAADSTNVVATADATDAQTAITLAIALKTAYNAHRALTAGSVHGAADSTNVTSAANPTRGTVVADDTVMARTFGPTWDTDGLADAFDAIRTSQHNPGLVVIVGAMSASDAATVTSGLDDLDDAGKEPTVLAETRLPDFETDETETAWKEAVETDFLSFDDSRICALAGYGLVHDLRTGNDYLRSGIAQVAADVVRVDRPVWPNCPNDRPAGMENFLLTDSSGALIGHDEGAMGNVTGLSNDDLGNRFASFYRDAKSGSATAVFQTVPWVLAASDEDIRNLMMRRVANALKRTVLATSFTALGATTFYTPADPEQNLPAMLTEEARRSIRATIFGQLNVNHRDDIQNYGDDDPDTGLVQVNPVVTITGGNLVNVEVIVSALVKGNILSVSTTLDIQS